MAVGDLVIFQNPSNYSVDDYRKDIASPSPSLKARVVDTAVNAICLIHKNTPVAWLADQIVNDGKIAPEHIMLNDLCSPRNQLPPSPVPEFSGGQCEAAYDVTTTVNSHVVDNGRRIDTTSTSVTVCVGKILRIEKRDLGLAVSSGEPQGRLVQIIAICKSSNNTINYPAPPGYVAALLGGSQPYAYDGYSVSFARKDGLPDNCGDPPAKYPIVPIPPESLDRTVSFPITPTLNAPVNVTVNPTVKFSPFILSPVISVNVGGVNVDFSLGGFTLTPTYNSPTTNNYPTSDPRTSPPPAITIKPPSSTGGTPVDLTEVITRLKDIEAEVIRCCDRDAPHSPPEARKVLSREYLVSDSGFQSLPFRTFQVTVDLLSRPDQEKVQFAKNGPNVIYAGWFWFAAGNHFSERCPVDTDFKVYSPPDRITDSFAIQLYKGYTAKVVAYYINPTK